MKTQFQWNSVCHHLGAEKNITYNVDYSEERCERLLPGSEYVLTALTIINRAGHGIWVRLAL